MEKRRSIGSLQIRQAYAFLLKAESEETLFTFEDFIQESGWTKKTASAMKSKKIGQFFSPLEGGYKSIGIKKYDEESFCRICSQTSYLAKDPGKPNLTPKVEGLVIKAREAALAAVQHYNNPTAQFRTANFIVLMIIAYTALFHAIFERDGIDYREKDDTGAARKIKNKLGDENSLWSAAESAKYYAKYNNKVYTEKELNGMVANIEFIIFLRNKIEHRFMPPLDKDVVGQCQLLLMNIEKILLSEFKNYYSLNTSLAIALQFSTELMPESAAALKRFQNAEYEELKENIAKYHRDLPLELQNDPAFVFKVYLDPVKNNNPRTSDTNIKFASIDSEMSPNISRSDGSIIAYVTKIVEVTQAPSKNHPYQFRKLSAKLGETLKGKLEFTSHDLKSVIHAHNISKHPEFFFQDGDFEWHKLYSEGFFNWILQQFDQNPNFFTEARNLYRENQKSKKLTKS